MLLRQKTDLVEGRSKETQRQSGRAIITPGALAVMLASVLLIGLLGLPPVALLLRAVGGRGWEGLNESGLPGAVYLSLITTLVTAGVTLLFGTPLAYLLARRRFPGKRLVNLMIELPIVLPPAVAGLALLMAFGRRGLLGPLLEGVGVTLPFTPAAVIIAQTFVSAPFYVRSAQVGFASIDPEIEDAARVDGAAGVTMFRSITLPLARRGLTAGLVLSWARALGEFGATILFAGSLQGRTQTMPLLVYNVLERDINASLWAGVLLLALALLALLAAQWLQRLAEDE